MRNTLPPSRHPPPPPPPPAVTHSVALCIGELPLTPVDVSHVEHLPRTEGLVLVGAVEQVLQLGTHKGAPLAGLHVQELWGFGGMVGGEVGWWW
jgi:hypothetical protein